MPLPKIGVLCAIAGMGGAEFSLLELVKHLRGTYEFHLIVPGDGPLKESAQRAGAVVWILPWPEAIERTGETGKRPGPVRLLRFAASLRSFARNVSDLLDEIGPTVFVTNALKAHVIGALARTPKDVPLIWYMRDGLEERAISRKLLALLARRCRLSLCISQYVAAQFRKYVSPSVPTAVVYNIVDLSRFRPGAAASGDLPKPTGEIWYGIAGAITPLKGQDIFLESAEKVLRKLPNARFLIAGNNPYVTQGGLQYEQSLRSRVENSPLRERVSFVGFRNDMPNLFSQLDVLVQPNRGPEGLGRSVLEAMACAVPVIAANKWGPAELIEHSGGGLLFPPLDTEQLMSHMLTLGQSESLRRIMGKRGHDWIQRNLVPTDLAEEFDRILADVMGTQREEAAA
jgi:glycosyltransferase involved in cell wall biosynthesis